MTKRVNKRKQALSFEKMGLLEFCDPNLDVDKLLDSDEKVAEEFDAKMHVTQTIQVAG